MNSLMAIIKGLENANKEQRVFDWERAAELIKRYRPAVAYAGLKEDWFYTSGIIYKEGIPKMSELAFLASTWATPVIRFDDREIECYKMQHEVPEWNAKTMWPEVALKILEER